MGYEHSACAVRRRLRRWIPGGLGPAAGADGGPSPPLGLPARAGRIGPVPPGVRPVSMGSGAAAPVSLRSTPRMRGTPRAGARAAGVAARRPEMGTRSRGRKRPRRFFAPRPPPPQHDPRGPPRHGPGPERAMAHAMSGLIPRWGWKPPSPHQTTFSPAPRSAPWGAPLPGPVRRADPCSSPSAPPRRSSCCCAHGSASLNIHGRSGETKSTKRPPSISRVWQRPFAASGRGSRLADGVFCSPCCGREGRRTESIGPGTASITSS